MSLGSTFGRLFFGPLSDHPKVNRLYVYQLSILCMGISNTLLPLMKTHGTIVCYCLVWGTFEGCYVALCAVLTADIVGRDKLSSGVGVLFGLKSVPLTGGPALAGDWHNFYFLEGGSTLWTQIITTTFILIPTLQETRLRREEFELTSS